MKKLQVVSVAVLVLSVLLMAVNGFLFSLPAWIVRAAGVVMLVSLAATVFLAVKRRKAA